MYSELLLLLPEFRVYLDRIILFDSYLDWQYTCNLRSTSILVYTCNYTCTYVLTNLSGSGPTGLPISGPRFWVQSRGQTI